MTGPSAEVKTCLKGTRASLLAWWRIGAVATLLVAAPTWAQFAHVPMPLVAGAPRTSRVRDPTGATSVEAGRFLQAVVDPLLTRPLKSRRFLAQLLRQG